MMCYYISVHIFSCLKKKNCKILRPCWQGCSNVCQIYKNMQMISLPMHDTKMYSMQKSIIESSEFSLDSNIGLDASTVIQNLIQANLDCFVYFYEFNKFFRKLLLSGSAKLGTAYLSNSDRTSMVRSTQELLKLYCQNLNLNL